jgi:hypothetical protein
VRQHAWQGISTHDSTQSGTERWLLSDILIHEARKHRGRLSAMSVNDGIFIGAVELAPPVKTSANNND